ncbi:cytokinin riboside 5'-monophosphate phosphoribohydrolase [Verrucomicrobiota bacterium]|nr:cytokinin riboside 5'-monophosphate phosphoribohydrolase [Verrucomicrobiota bacterium]
MKRLCVFCGSSAGHDPVFAAAARELGAAIARKRWGLVYGAGNVGLMGVLADAVLAAEGEVIGVIPEALVAKELAHRGLSELHIVASMHERKALMAELADGFVAMPGGFGTLDEFCEILTWAQLGLHRKPCGLLNVAGYFDPLLQQVERAVAGGFVRAEHQGLFVVETEPMKLLQRLVKFTPPKVEKWIRAEET